MMHGCACYDVGAALFYILAVGTAGVSLLDRGLCIACSYLAKSHLQRIFSTR